jgi:polysaccharide deacetylase family protein (PEP-CTERM system associated)
MLSLLAAIYTLLVPLALMNAFTVDVEDYYHVSGFERHVARDSWGSHASRVELSTRKLIELMARHNVRGTFFILGWIAQRFPRLVREIQAAGHELGSHSFWHRLVYSLSPAEFRQDVRDSKAAIEDAAGETVTCYRAPSFSITRKSLWALEILREEGFTVDASIFPTRHDRYGIPEAKPEIHRWTSASGSIIVYPSTVSRVCGWNVPTGGGGYFRLYPWRFPKLFLQRVLNSGRPIMFYVHPWEIDPDQPRFSFGSRGTRFRHYVNLRQTAHKLDRLLQTFAFGSMRESIAQYMKSKSLAEVSFSAERSNAAPSVLT